MSKRYPGNFITGNPVALSQTSNNGIWDLSDNYTATGNSTWQEPDGIYEIGRSLRFRKSATAYLTRTPTVTGNRKTFTFSTWAKLSKNPSVTNGEPFYFMSAGTNTPWSAIAVGYNDSTGPDACLQFSNFAGSQIGVYANITLRDTAAWYHIVCAIDTTQLALPNRIRFFINGVQVENIAGNYPDQNADTFVNNTNTHWIGTDGRSGSYFDGYMAETQLIDGQSLDASYFGYFDPITNIWQPKKYTGSYGTNGFYILGNTTPETIYANYIGGANSGNYLTAPYSTDFALTNSDFTLEAFVFAADAFTNNDHAIFNLGENVTSVNGKSLILTGYAGGSSPCRTLRMALSSNGSTNDLVSYVDVGNIELYTWNHVAVTRTGGYVYVYINGKRVYSFNIGSTSLYNQTTYGPSIASYRNNGSFGASSSWPGAISNVRFTIGQCLYTGTSFTVPTAPLTTTSQGATSSNVKLLCCQSSTAAVDNSQYARTLTNVGTTAFLDHIMSFTDKSGNGNTWGFNNQLVLNLPGNRSTANWDIMVDSPTNVFTTATDVGGVVPGNYCTWNSLSKSPNITLTEANLKTLGTANDWQSQHATMATQAGGKWYWEYVCYPNFNGNQGFCKMIGIVPPEGTPTNNYIGNASYGYGLWIPDGSGGTAFVKRYNGTNTTLGSNYALVNGDVIQVAYDALNGQIWFGKNNTWFEGNPSAGTGASYTSINTSVQWLPALNEWAAGVMTNNFTQTNFGQRPFAYTPPTGFKSLNTTNIQALGTSAVGKGAIQANKWMDVSLYGGTSSTLTVTNSGFQPDLIWIKRRTATGDHALLDVARGPSATLASNSTDSEGNQAFTVVPNSTGFTINSADNLVNGSTLGYVAWQWKQSPTSGFNIIPYTGNSVTSRSISHNLGVAPSMILYKRRSGTAQDWGVYHSSMGLKLMQLNTTSALWNGAANYWYSAPSSSVIYPDTTNGDNYQNTNGVSYIAYAWAEVPGFSKFGSYTGNGSLDGTFVYTGFEPRFVMIKSTVDVESWVILDAARNRVNIVNNNLLPNSNLAENVVSGLRVQTDFTANGFKSRGITDSSVSIVNKSGSNYIYAAFAESPFALNNRAR